MEQMVAAKQRPETSTAVKQIKLQPDADNGQTHDVSVAPTAAAATVIEAGPETVVVVVGWEQNSRGSG